MENDSKHEVSTCALQNAAESLISLPYAHLMCFLGYTTFTSRGFQFAWRPKFCAGRLRHYRMAGKFDGGFSRCFRYTSLVQIITSRISVALTENVNIIVVPKPYVSQ